MKRDRGSGVYAVILAGGPGERFWPLSRVKNPKYVIELAGSRSMIELAVARLKGLVPKRNILIVTTKDQIGVMKKRLKRLAGTVNFLVEPCSRDTAAAIGLAAIYIRKKNPDSVMLVLPSDQLIRDEKIFRSAMKKAIGVAQRDCLVTLGIRPTAPLTGYGYIKIRNQQPATKSRRPYYSVERFIEKPDRKTAERFLRDNRYFWNSGIFAWKAETILKGIRKHMPQLHRALMKIGRGNSGIYKGLKKISIDYGIMEKADNKVMVPAGFSWSDLGSWLSLEEIYKKDGDKNVYKGLSVNHDTKDSVIIGSRNHLIATSGVRNLIVVHTDDATLVAEKGRAQEIKKLVRLIRKKGLNRFL